jgi:hypothetical protein
MELLYLPNEIRKQIIKDHHLMILRMTNRYFRSKIKKKAISIKEFTSDASVALINYLLYGDRLLYFSIDNIELYKNAVKYAAYHGRMDIIQWGAGNIFGKLLCFDYYVSTREKILLGRNDKSKVGCCDDIHVLKVGNKPTPKTALDNAASTGHLKILQLLLKHNSSYGDMMFAHAAANGKNDIIRWLIDNEYFAGKTNRQTIACLYAANFGHLYTLKLLRWYGCKWNAKNISVCAATNGQLEILKYLIKSGISIKDDLYTFAIPNGHLEVVKYLLKNMCKWYPFAYVSAIAHKQHVISKWFKKQNYHCPCDDCIVIKKTCSGMLLYHYGCDNCKIIPEVVSDKS